MTIHADNLGKKLQHLSDAQLAAAQIPGVHLVFDDPTVGVEHLSGTSGVTDVFVFDGSAAGDNVTSIDHFDPTEDYILFRNMGGRDVLVSTWALTDQPIFGQDLTAAGDGVHGKIEITATTQTMDQSAIGHYVLSFDGTLVF
jgi:hypothetical protein